MINHYTEKSLALDIAEYGHQQEISRNHGAINVAWPSPSSFECANMSETAATMASMQSI